MSTVKEDTLKLIESLPSDCTLEDIQYHLLVRAKVEAGLAAAEAGRVVPQEQVRQQVAEWLKSFGRNRP